jgi:hypothetical protein
MGWRRRIHIDVASIGEQTASAVFRERFNQFLSACNFHELEEALIG